MERLVTVASENDRLALTKNEVQNGDTVFVDAIDSSSTYFVIDDTKLGRVAPEWTQSTLPSTANWFSVCYGNGKFVTVAYNSNISAYSTDGITWTQTTLPSNTYWYSVCYGNGKYVTVANDSNISAYSTDGITWIQTTLPSSKSWRSVCYGNGKFVTVAYDSNISAYSTDGTLS